jgi:CubicO group peptidase (beta-lactamase class C family)
VDALRQIDTWPVGEAAAVVVHGGGDAVAGTQDHSFPWASLTKLATALVTLVAAEEGVVDLDQPAGPEGSTVRHLLSHASGLGPEPGPPIARPGQRRIYSNHGFDVLAKDVEGAAEMPFERYFAQVLHPREIGVELVGSAGSGGRSSSEGLLALARELVAPALVAKETLAEATTVQFPGLTGVLPGFGRQEPNDWGLGFELRDGKRPHWTGERNSPRTFGHFGQSGTFLWVDPDAGVALGVLTDRPFGDWAREAWPRLSDAVLAEAAGGA